MGIAGVIESRFDLAEREARPHLDASLAPLVAGARARGMADAFDMLGLAAILLDDEGAALHVSECARRLLGADLTLARGRLRVADVATDTLLQSVIKSALIDRTCSASPIIVLRGAGRPSLRLRIALVQAGSESAQLLKAVVLIDFAGAPAEQALEGLS